MVQKRSKTLWMIILSFILTSTILSSCCDDDNATDIITAKEILSFDVSDFTVKRGESFMAPKLYNPNNFPVKWTSSNESVATVDENGVITPISYGTTTISATYNGSGFFIFEKASYTLNVLAPYITKVIDESGEPLIYNFEYPSLDPYGNYAMLSGSIVIGDEVKESKSAAAMLLYNHFTVYGKHEVPSKGQVAFLQTIVGDDLIAVAADYYGFGATEDKNQAYCMSGINGQASAEALVSARELLAEMGYTWSDMLFNFGYSQGGQTAIAVLRYCAENHPEIKFTHTLAAGGPYDIAETYKKLAVAGKSAMPSTVINVLLAYNEYKMLGYQREQLFIEPTLSRIDKYLLSKDYGLIGVELNLTDNDEAADWLRPELLDFNSEISKTFMRVFDQDRLTHNWTPNSNERITIYHNEADDVVPVGNAINLKNFFSEKGLTITTDEDNKYADGTVYYFTNNAPSIGIIGNHGMGTLYYAAELSDMLCHYLDVSPWFTITEDDIKKYMGY